VSWHPRLLLPVGAAVLVLLATAGLVTGARLSSRPDVATGWHGGTDPAPPASTATASATASAAASADPAQSASGTPSPAPGARAADAGAAPARFATLPPGAALPSGARCATWVRAHPYAENKGVNKRANQTTGQAIGAGFFQGDDPRANSRVGVRVDGKFTGTTREILRWAACKWGVDEDLVLAQAAIESWWHQDTLGDWTGDASRCAPGRGLGADGKPGQCPESFGILQNRYPYEKSAWPGIASSTALNADLAYAIWRVCFEGYEGWLNTAEHGQAYAAGDAWGCVGRWFSGRWHVAAGDQYTDRVRGYLDQRIWETANFQQP
jgi:autotransporter family porin